MTSKACTKCNEAKPLESFAICSRNKSGRASHCKDCKSRFLAAKKNKTWVATGRYRLSPEDEKRSRWSAILKNKYGITLARYEEMSESLGGLCEICRMPETLAGKKRLAVDHCHAHGHIRGLLCSSCNKALGGFRDSPELLEQAAAYLRRTAGPIITREPTNDNYQADDPFRVGATSL